jgi:hypothetical protein
MESQAIVRTATVISRRSGLRIAIAFTLMAAVVVCTASSGSASGATATVAAQPWSACTSGLNVSGSPRTIPAGFLLDAVSSPTASDAWAVGSLGLGAGATPAAEYWDGSTWTVIPVDPESIERLSLIQATFDSVVAFSPTDVWVGGTQEVVGDYFEGFVPLLLRWNGSEWLQENPPIEDEATGVVALAGTSGGDLWVAEDTNSGTNLMWHRNGSSWGWQDAVISVRTLYAYAPGFVIAGGQYGGNTAATINFDSGGNFAFTTDPGSTAILALSGTGLDDLWAYALPTAFDVPWELQHYNGSSWTNVASSWGNITVASVGTDKAEAVVENDGYTQALQVSVTGGSVVTSETPLTWDPSLGSEIVIYAMASTPRGALFAVGEIYGNRNPQGILYRDC